MSFPSTYCLHILLDVISGADLFSIPPTLLQSSGIKDEVKFTFMFKAEADAGADSPQGHEAKIKLLLVKTGGVTFATKTCIIRCNNPPIANVRYNQTNDTYSTTPLGAYSDVVGYEVQITIGDSTVSETGKNRPSSSTSIMSIFLNKGKTPKSGERSLEMYFFNAVGLKTKIAATASGTYTYNDDIGEVKFKIKPHYARSGDTTSWRSVLAYILPPNASNEVTREFEWYYRVPVMPRTNWLDIQIITDKNEKVLSFDGTISKTYHDFSNMTHEELELKNYTITLVPEKLDKSKARTYTMNMSRAPLSDENIAIEVTAGHDESDKISQRFFTELSNTFQFKLPPGEVYFDSVKFSYGECPLSVTLLINGAINTPGKKLFFNAASGEDIHNPNSHFNNVEYTETLTTGKTVGNFAGTVSNGMKCWMQFFISDSAPAAYNTATGGKLQVNIMDGDTIP